MKPTERIVIHLNQKAPFQAAHRYGEVTQKKHVALGREHGEYWLGALAAGRARLQYRQCGFG
jgi:hypothetical protein